MTRDEPRAAGGAPRGVAWGVLDQAVSSATNLGLSVVAARLLGPGGLGIVAIGFSVYVAVQTLHRSLVVDPLIVASSRGEPPQRRQATRSGLTVAVSMTVAITLVLVLLGLLIGGPIGQGIILFTPWTALAVLQDMWRAILFRDGRGAGAALNDGVWAIGMVAMIPVAWVVRDLWTAVAAWGVGAALGGLLGFAQLRLRPMRMRVAGCWWRTEAWPLGRWIMLATTLHSVGSQVLILILASLLGPVDIGGLRAALVLFAPMTLLGPAMTLTALPALARRSRESPRGATVLAARFSLLTVTLLVCYLAVATVFRERLLSALFGVAFAPYAGLVLPIGLGQVAFAASLGFSVMLRASRRGGSIVIGYTLTVAVQFVLATSLARPYGLTGATWGLALGTITGCATTIVLALLSVRPARRPSGTS